MTTLHHSWYVSSVYECVGTLVLHYTFSNDYILCIAIAFLSKRPLLEAHLR